MYRTGVCIYFYFGFYYKGIPEILTRFISNLRTSHEMRFSKSLGRIALAPSRRRKVYVGPTCRGSCRRQPSNGNVI